MVGSSKKTRQCMSTPITLSRATMERLFMSGMFVLYLYTATHGHSQSDKYPIELKDLVPVPRKCSRLWWMAARRSTLRSTGFIFISNLSLFIFTVTKNHFDSFYLAKVVLANLFCSILIWQEYVVSAIFTVFSSVPTSWPFFIRAFCARVYHIGGSK